MTHRVFVDGQEGTTGLRIHEYLAQRRDIEVLRIEPDRRKDPAERARLLNAADVAFLCAFATRPSFAPACKQSDRFPSHPRPARLFPSRS